MELGSVFRHVARLVPRGVDGVKCFERELAAAGGLTFRVDLGIRAIPTARIVGSVGRWNNLRQDFFYKDGLAMEGRYRRIGEAMARDKPLPAIEVYELRTPCPGGPDTETHSEYYVVDGHHRVAMAKKLGRDFLDAHVVLYRASSVLGA